MNRILTLTLGLLLLAAPVFAVETHHGPELDGKYWFDQLVKFINIGLVIGLLVYFLRKPVIAFFRTRAQQIEDNLNAAKRAREEAEAKLEAVKAEVAQIEQKITGVVGEARKEGELEKSRIIRQAKEEAERMLKNAEKEIENRVRAGRKELKNFAAKLAVEKAREELTGRLTEQDDAAIIDRTISRIGGAQ